MLNNCVKNVNNMWFILSIISESIYTYLIRFINKLKMMCINYLFINIFIQTFKTIYSTYIRTFYNLLNNTFTHNPQYLLLIPLNNKLKER